MTARWYLARRGKADGNDAAFGPVSAARLLELVASGGTCPGDFVWMENTDVQITVEQFLEMAAGGQLPAREAGAPDGSSGSGSESPTEPVLPGRLDDVARYEASSLSKPRPLPDWMEDVRASEDLAARAAPGARAEGNRAPARPSAAIPLDWLEDIRQIEESLSRPPPAQCEVQPAAEGPGAPPPTPLPPEPPPAAPPSTSPEQRGHDPETGQILDPVAFALWLKAESQRRRDELEAQPVLTVAETFLEAQRALQEWVDDDANKPVVAAGDMEAVRNCPAVQDLLRRYEQYGSLMREKLWNRLALLVDNRQKFFKAFG